MLRLLVALPLLLAPAAWAGFGGMGTVSNDSGGDLSLVAIGGGVLFFVGLYFFMTRFQNELHGFAWLVGAVLVFLVFAGLTR